MIRVLVSIIFGGIIFVYVGNTIGWDFILTGCKKFLSFEGVIIIALSFFIAFLGSLRWKKILKGEKIKEKDLFKTYIGGFSLMYLFPMILFGSELFRASILKHRYKVNLDSALASVFIERILEWTINIIVIITGVLYFFYAIKKPTFNLGIIFAGTILITLIILIAVYFYIFKKKSFLRNILFKLKKENIAVKVEQKVFEYFDVKNINLWEGYFLSFLKAMAMFLRVWIILYFLDSILPLREAYPILGFSFLSTLIPIPAALGVQELIQAFAFENLSIKTGISSVFSMLLRNGDIIVSLTGLVLFSKIGYDFLFKNEKRKNSKNIV